MPIDFPSNPALNQIFTTNTKSWIYGTAGWKAYDVVGTVANTSVTGITATENQTVFTVPTYVQGRNQVRVFINGVRQNNIIDYIETSTSSITLTSPAAVGDNVAFEISTFASTPINIGFPTILNDASTDAIKYPLFASSTTGGLDVVNTDSGDLTYNPLTGTLTANNINIGSTNPVDVLDYIITYNLAFG